MRSASGSLLSVVTVSVSPQEKVRRLISAGKVKKKCCASTPRCKKCPVRALKKAKKKAARKAIKKATDKATDKATEKAGRKAARDSRPHGR